MIQQSHSWAYTQRKMWFQKIHVCQCSLQHYLQQPAHGSCLNVHRHMNEERRCGTYDDRILLSHKKEQNCAVCKDVDGPRDCNTDWSNLESENKYCILTHICGIRKKWYRWTYLQSRNRDTDIENKHMETNRGRRVGRIVRLGLMYTYF